MADILVRFEVNPDGATEKVGDIKSDNTDLINNVGINVDSTGIYIIKPDGTFKGTEMLSLATGKLKFNESGYLANSKTSPSGKLQSYKNPRAYVWGATNSNGQLTKKYENGTEEVVNLTITIQKTSDSVNIDKIVLIGDKVAQQFPTEVYLDGDSTSLIYSDDAHFAIEFSNPLDVHTITITKWNRPNYNATLTQIRAMLQYLEYDKASIDSINILSESNTDPSSISYGVLASSGSGLVLDKDLELRDLVNSKIISNSGLKYNIMFNGKPIKEQIIDDSSYLYGEWKFSSTDELKNTSNGIFNPTYDDYKLKDITVINLLTHILQNSTPKFTFSFSDKLSEAMFNGTELKNIDVSELSSHNLEQILNYICEITQSSIIVNGSELRISSDRTTYFSDEIKNAIHIPIDCVVEDSGFSYIVNNRYDKVNYSVNKTNKNIQSIPPIDPTSFTSDVDYNTAIEYIKDRSIYDSGDIVFKDLPVFFDVSYGQAPAYNQNNEVIADFIWGIKKISFEDYTKFIKNGSSFLITTFYTQPSKNHKDIKFINFPLRHYVRDLNTSLMMFMNDVYFNNLFDDDNLIVSSIFEDDNSSPNNNYVKSFYLMVLIKKTDNVINYPFRFLLTSQSERESTDSVYIERIQKETVDLEFKVGETFKNPISFEENPLLTSDGTSPVFNSSILEDVSSIAYNSANNIFLDYYNNTVYTKKVNIYMNEYFYNINGDIVKNVKSGDIINVGDIVYFTSDKHPNGDYIFWMVFGVDFIYDGEPYLILSLASITGLTQIYGLFNNSKVIKSWESLVSDGDVSVSEDKSGKYITGVNKELEGTLKIDKSIYSISQSAFSDCKLKQIGLPYGLKNIMPLAFKNSTLLEKITIPDTVTTIYGDAFSGCSKLSAYFYKFDYVSNGNNKSSYTAYLGNPNNLYRYLIMPTSREEQYGCHPSTKMIAYRAFSGITELKSVTLNDGIETIGAYAFMDCTSLTTINFPSSIKELGVNSFSNTAIKIIDISNLINIEILNGAFNSTNQLETVLLPQSLKEIGLGAFHSCSRLITLIIPSGVTIIGPQAFYGCKELQSIWWNSIDEHKSSLKEIGQMAFYNAFQNNNIQDIPFVIPASCNKIDTFAFYGCTGLSKIEFKDPNGWKIGESIYDSNPIIPDLSNPSNNAILLKETYKNYVWFK